MFTLTFPSMKAIKYNLFNQYYTDHKAEQAKFEYYECDRVILFSD